MRVACNADTPYVLLGEWQKSGGQIRQERQQLPAAKQVSGRSRCEFRYAVVASTAAAYHD
ncbi:hypothetical protein CF68_22990 [Cupriavidus sp. SK-4]|nr:hypothetical protein CF68_22990 [Cupriavidus sp. SK-4]